jgi:hypothetical protein
MDISSIKEKYLKHDQAIRNLFTQIDRLQIPIELPIANTVLIDISKRIDNIFNSILLLAGADNLYSLFILYRSILEHSYKAFYIFAKTTTNKNDETAEKYQKHLFISEFLAEQAGVLEMEDLINENETKADFLNFLLTKFPELQGFDKENQKEISAAIKEFRLSEIIKFLHGKFSEKEKNKNIAPVFAQTLPEYSHVSTFTHGGSYASNLMEKFTDQNLISQEIDKIVKISFTVCGVIKENIFITYRLDKNFLDILKTLHELRKP